MTTMIVIAKECIPGRVKTRLSPPFTPEQAATLASASLADTLDAASRLPFNARVLAWDGGGAPVGPEWTVVPQASGSLDERLATVIDEVGGSVVLIGMDSPQFDPDCLAPYCASWPDDVDAVIGHSTDGGFWVIGFRRARGELIRGVPMSCDDTGTRQERRLTDAGLRVAHLPVLTDVDTAEDAEHVAQAAPHGRFAAAFRDLMQGAAR